MHTPKMVMIIDDDADLVAALRTRCERIGLRTEGLTDGGEAVSSITRLAPDLVILDVNIPTISGVSVCNALAASPQLAPIPIIVPSGRDDEETIDRCRELGAHYVLRSGDVWSWLEPLIFTLLDMAPHNEMAIDEPAASSEPTVLLIDDDADLGSALRIRLLPHGIRVIYAATGMQGYWTALKDRPDVIICDYRMPQGRGDYVINRLRQHSLTRDIPVFVLTGWRREGRTDFGLEREMKNLGVRRLFLKPIDFDELLEEIHQALPHRADAQRCDHSLVCDRA